MYLVSVCSSIKTPPRLESVYDHTKRCIDLIGGIDSFVPPHAKILLKPNVGINSFPEEARNTDPAVIAAMIVLLKEFGIKDIVVGESAIVGTDTRAAYHKMGIDSLARKHGVKLVDLKKLPLIRKPVPNPLVLPSIKVSAVIDEVDIIVNLAKLKTVCAVPASMGMKNLKGLLPDKEKKRFHHTDLNKAIVDLNKVVKPCLTIIDGITASELYKPKETRILFAGGNILAVDMVAAASIGIDFQEIAYLRLAAEQGMGPDRIDQIEVLGDPVPESLSDFKRAPDNTHAFADLFPEVEIIDGDACSGCVASLYLSLKISQENGTLEQVRGLNIAMGSKIETLPTDKTVFYVGNCTQKVSKGKFLTGCPFIYMEFEEYLKKKFL